MSGSRRVSLVLVAGLLAAGCGGGGARLAAQPSSMSSTNQALDRIEAAADAGQLEAARARLREWLALHGEDAAHEDAVRARFLGARLTTNADSARGEYLWVAIDGRSAYAAEAWLRLGQLELLESQAGRAASNLERLRADHPGSPLVPESWYWTGLARQADGDLDGACAAWRRALEAGRASASVDLAARTRDAMRPCASGTLRFTVQLGAFRESDAATTLRDRADAAGFVARIEREEGFFKVRIGRFGSTTAALEMATRLQEAGFDAVVLAATPERRR